MQKLQDLVNRYSMSAQDYSIGHAVGDKCQVVYFNLAAKGVAELKYVRMGNYSDRLGKLLVFTL